MNQVFGIDFGTTYSSIATIDRDGIPIPIENIFDSSPVLASVVYFPDGGLPIVGKEAKAYAETEPEKVVQFFKRVIGNNAVPVRCFNGVDYDPVSIYVLILSYMLEYARIQGYEVNHAVVAIPHYYRSEEKAAIIHVLHLAGVKDFLLVNEISAAAMSYYYKKTKCNKAWASEKCLVYDLGGATFDVAIIDSYIDKNGKPANLILATDGDDRLGGIDWDARLYDYICELYQDENGVSQDEMDAELRHKIKSQVEDVKRSLSNMQSCSFTINYSGDSTHIVVSREKFEELTSDLVTKTTNYIHILLEKAGLTVDAIDTILLVGGSTRMPMIKNAVDAIFTSNKVHRTDPDHGVAKGAAIYAQLLNTS